MRIDDHLAPRRANHVPLTPVEFLLRSAAVHAERPAVVWRDRSWTYRDFGALVARFAAMLRDLGIGAGDVVSVMCANRPEMLAAHYAVPMLGAVLNTINTRLDFDTVVYILGHAESRLVLADPTSAEVASAAARAAGVAFRVFGAQTPDALDLLSGEEASLPGSLEAIADEWQPLCLNYTSGTTGRPKGVVYHHRGAYLNALGNVLALGLTERCAYLWTLPMFHCNGWCHTWAVTAAGALHVCLEKPDPALIFPLIEAHGVTHLACAPVVLYMLLNHPARALRDASRRVAVATGGAAPTSALIEQLGALGLDLTHLYGLTESFGPATLRALSDEERALSAPQKADLLAKQGVRHVTAGRVKVVDEAGGEVARDGLSTGEIVLAGNTLMAGYYRDAEATAAAFKGGVFHTGDLAVVHPDGNIEIKDRAKDIIISGGENISSLEVENALHQHPAVLMAAVVAAPDLKWGEVPCAFIELKPGATATPDEMIGFCRTRLPGFKVPRRFVFRELPKTATGKIQKFLLRLDAKDGERAGDA